MLHAASRYVVGLLCALGIATAGLADAPARSIQRAKFVSGKRYLIVEILDDTVAHFELSAMMPGPDETKPIYSTPMVAHGNFRGPRDFKRVSRSIFDTGKMRIEVDPASLCVKYRDAATELTELCPHRLHEYWKGFTLTRGAAENYYGLGQEFRDPGHADGDLMGRVRHYGAIHGNAMTNFNGGSNGNTQIPVLYALGKGNLNFAIFLDQNYQQQWDFTFDPAKVEMYGDHVRWYFLAGNSLPELRHQYMDLVGKPLVPPKKMFGLWVSEYGYRDWGHMESKLATLRANRFPVDGFLLDLFWFGGVRSNSDDTNMGRLTWDHSRFPFPEKKLASLRDEEGVGIIPIEESYIGKNLSEHAGLAQNGYLAKDEHGNPAYIGSGNTWWGKGGMIDWSNPGASDYWHEKKRVDLLQAGIAGHWLDLGEPEMVPPNARYARGLEPDVHNLYNFFWIEGIFKGYEKYTPNLRPFMVSRSGAAGIQRFGAAMWSGDIGSDLTSLASHQNAQMHMSLSGIDYYGADIGGFHRGALKGDLHDMYTQWFAYGMLFDIPGRPHTENLCDCRETAPDRIGDLSANRENLRWRYRLIPYVYSLAHLAHEKGDPVFPPLVYYFQSDPKVRTMARQKMIGPSLLSAVTAKYGRLATSVYLPRGNWADFYTGQEIVSRGETVSNVSLYPEGKFRLPLYAMEGAIIPLMHVDSETMNSLGKRIDGSRRDELVARIFPSTQPTQFTLYEDDGVSTAYKGGNIQRTVIRQEKKNSEVVVTIEAATGHYAGAPTTRNNLIEVFQKSRWAGGVSLDTRPLPERQSLADFENHDAGWILLDANRTLVKTGAVGVHQEKRVVLH